MTNASKDIDLQLAERVRRACLAELERGYQEAAIQGLCAEGALEYALDRLRRLDSATLLSEATRRER